MEKRGEEGIYKRENLTPDTTIAGPTIGRNRIGNNFWHHRYRTENGAKIDEREARRDKVLIEFPTTQNTIHLTHYTHNLTLSQA